MTVCSIELSILHMIVISSRMILINYPHGLASGKCKLMKLNMSPGIVVDLRILLALHTC